MQSTSHPLSHPVLWECSLVPAPLVLRTPGGRPRRVLGAEIVSRDFPFFATPNETRKKAPPDASHSRREGETSSGIGAVVIVPEMDG